MAGTEINAERRQAQKQRWSRSWAQARYLWLAADHNNATYHIRPYTLPHHRLGQSQTNVVKSQISIRAKPPK